MLRYANAFGALDMPIKVSSTLRNVFKTQKCLVEETLRPLYNLIDYVNLHHKKNPLNGIF